MCSKFLSPQRCNMFSLFRNAGAAAGLSPREAVEKAAAGDMIIIDVRDPMEVRMSGMADGAVNIPLAAFQMRVDPRSPECVEGLATDKCIGVYCASGARSSMAKQVLENLGYQDVHNIGGFGHWVQAGGPVAK